MPKPKAPSWLRETFRDGVDEREADSTPRDRLIWPVAGPGINVWCYLGHHDERQRPCSGPLERFRFIGRQRVENALGALLPDYAEAIAAGDVEPGGAIDFIDWQTMLTDVILVAAWDPRNGGIACQHHHRRFDNHATPELVVPRRSLPAHVVEFAEDWGLEPLERRFG